MSIIMYELNQIYQIPIDRLSPSQPADGYAHVQSDNPIEVCVDNEKLIVVHGNHRYYDALERGLQTIAARIVINPYTNW